MFSPTASSLLLVRPGLAMSSSNFMLAMVVSSATSSVLLAMNFLSLKHRSTNRPSIFSVPLLLAAGMVAVVMSGLGATETVAGMQSVPFLVALALAGAAALLAAFGLWQFTTLRRHRRGRKRAVGVLVASGCFFIGYGISLYLLKHPAPIVPPKEEQGPAIPEATPPPARTPALIPAQPAPSAPGAE